MTDVNINFVRYCKAYLTERCSLSETQAQILVLDPELGPPIDQLKRRWALDMMPKGIDPDDLLVPGRFDAPEMEPINELLASFAAQYAARAPRIRTYLGSIGHPLADSIDGV